MSLDWTWAPEVGLPAPDLLLFLDVDEDEAQRRGGFGNERYEYAEMQQMVRQTFYELLQRMERELGTTTKIITINANQDADAVASDIWAATAELRSLVEDGDIHDLGVLQPLPGASALASD